MVTKQLNKTLTEIGPGTPMGETIRRYWIPALLSFELPEPDCPPVRVRLLGEDLIAFRDTNGRVGLLDEFCPHRRASLWLARNEECGLRCVYHGWKYDVDGNCVDQMNEPTSFADKIHIKAYSTVEMGDVIWAYMGPVDKKPPVPRFEWTQVPATHRYATKVLQECNWLQGLEGGIDTSHAPILHRKISLDTDKPGIPLNSAFVQGRAPKLQVDNTDYGYRYYGVRPMEDDGTYVRAYHYVMPFTQLRPSTGAPHMVDGHFWVPMDDHNVMVWNFGYTFGEEPLSPGEGYERGSGNNFGTDVIIENGFRSVRNKGNDWLIDRQAQKHETFTGIQGINTQDRAVQEAMGTVVDRSKEFLGPADIAIVQARRLLEDATKTVEDGGDPPGVGASYYHIRAAESVFGPGVDWHEELMDHMYPAEPAVTIRQGC